MAKNKGNAEVVQAGAEAQALTVADENDLMLLIQQIAGDRQFQTVVSSASQYWPMEQNKVCHGILVDRVEITTQFGPIGMYTVKLSSACDAVKRDGEVIVAAPGESITVLERAQLKRLNEHLGEEVIIVCKDKIKTKDGKRDLWSYEVVAFPNVTQTPKAAALPASA